MNIITATMMWAWCCFDRHY